MKELLTKEEQGFPKEMQEIIIQNRKAEEKSRLTADEVRESKKNIVANWDDWDFWG